MKDSVMRDRFNRNFGFWVVTLVLPVLAACGAKPGNQPKKVATESGPAGQAGPVGPLPGPVFGENPAAIGAASQKVLVYHLSKSAVLKPGDAPELESLAATRRTGERGGQQHGGPNRKCTDRGARQEGLVLRYF